MNENDTVDLWYAIQERKLREMNKRVSAEEAKPKYSCCYRFKEQGHDKFCVNFQPEGETKTNRIVQHLPGYIDFDIECIGFDTLEELLNIEWVKWWSKQKGFYRYSAGGYLMAECNNGYDWYALGKLRNPVNLPKWVAKYER